MTNPFLNFLSSIALASALLGPCNAAAQVQRPAPSLEGRTFDGQSFRLDQLKGKVVLLMFWSTDCAVCRDKMPELRQNIQGWTGKPFELVLVSVDRRQQDLVDYERIVGRMIPVKQRFIQLWAGEAGYRDGFGKPLQLPSSYLIDKSGHIIENYAGRIPAEAWDKIADLL
jgi:peroxiredoxin